MITETLRFTATAILKPFPSRTKATGNRDHRKQRPQKTKITGNRGHRKQRPQKTEQRTKNKISERHST